MESIFSYSKSNRKTHKAVFQAMKVRIKNQVARQQTQRGKLESGACNFSSSSRTGRSCNFRLQTQILLQENLMQACSINLLSTYKVKKNVFLAFVPLCLTSM
jgi:hypothetical protein